MSYLNSFVKDPAAVRRYTMDWEKWLDEGDVIVTADWTIEPAAAGLTLASPPTLGGTKATVQLAGGVVGQEYAVACHVTTMRGEQDERSIRIAVKQR